MSIRAITFDFWRTLFRHTHSEVRRANRIRAFCEATRVAPDAAEAAMAFAEIEFTRIHLGEHRTLSSRDAVEIMAEQLGLSLQEATIEALSEQFARGILNPPPPVIDGAMEAVRKAGERFPIGLISDTGFSPGTFLRPLLRDQGVLDLFGVLVFSDEVGVSKPQRPMFESAARGLKVAPDEMLHIGDLEVTDIVGAKEFGAKAAGSLGHRLKGVFTRSSAA